MDDSCDCCCDAVTLFLPRLHKLDEESVGVSGTDHTGGVKGREGFGKQLHPVPLQFLNGLLNILDEKVSQFTPDENSPERGGGGDAMSASLISVSPAFNRT